MALMQLPYRARNTSGKTKVTKTLVMALLLSGALGACGQKTRLTPVEDASLPPPTYAQTVNPNSDQLLELDTLAAPERNVELRRRSEEREDDPFELPPE